MPTTLLTPDLALSIHLTADGEATKDCVLYNGQKLGLLQYFHLAYDVNGLRTKFGCIGPFPTLEPPPENVNANSVFPLRMRFGHYIIGENGVANTPDEMITLCSRPLGFIKALYVHLRIEQPREIRLVFYAAKKELLDALHEMKIDAVVDQPTPMLILGLLQPQED